MSPPVLKFKNYNRVPVFRRTNNKASVDRKTFMAWFDNCFAHEVEEYLPRNNSAFKVVPMLYTALGHPATVQHTHPNTEVIFLPPNITSFIQLLDQGNRTTSNSNYTRLIVSYILDMMENNHSFTVRECCSCRMSFKALPFFWKRSSNSKDSGGTVVRCFLLCSSFFFRSATFIVAVLVLRLAVLAFLQGGS
jgi:DDE superfamily endonuclease.